LPVTGSSAGTGNNASGNTGSNNVTVPVVQGSPTEVVETNYTSGLPETTKVLIICIVIVAILFFFLFIFLKPLYGIF